MARGDHIQVRRMAGLYYHHGIDLGDGTVIHFSGEPLNRKTAKVARVTEEEFLSGQIKEVIEYPSGESVLPPEETVLLAEGLLDTEGYHLFYNNCEHFATYCKTGKKRSRQVQSLRKAATVTAGVAAAVVIVVFTDQVRKRNGQGRA